MCSEEVWKCTQCLGINDATYEFLASSEDHGLHWYCDKCEGIIEEGIGPLSVKLLGLLKSLDQKMCDVTLNIEQKISEATAKLEQVFDDKIKAVELLVEQVILNKTELSAAASEVMHQDLVSKVDDIKSKLDSSLTPLVQSCIEDAVKSQLTEVQGCIEGAGKSQLTEDKAEEQEIQRRKTSVIGHGIAESDADTASKRNDTDIMHIVAMLNELDISGAKIEQAIRLGKKRPESDIGNHDLSKSYLTQKKTRSRLSVKQKT